MKISRDLTRAQVAAAVVAKLHEQDINAVLVGGSVVSIYTNNKYESFDLDFISPASHERITSAMMQLGFKPEGRYFVHEESPFAVEFPPGPLAIGDDVPVEPEGALTSTASGLHCFRRPNPSWIDLLSSISGTTARDWIRLR